MHAITANQSTGLPQSKVELYFQSKVQLAVASICLTAHAASVFHNKDANLQAEDLKGKTRLS